MERLKAKWGITSNLQLIIIFIVFAITGMSALQVKYLIFPFFGIDETTPFYIRMVVWLFTVFPFYYVFLLSYGFIFGQFNFFWNMTKKTFGRFGKLFGRG
ncbi:MAG: DUF6787 family protein [Cytophagaceae bacterium]